jgi:molybdate transport system regulatory protein
MNRQDDPPPRQPPVRRAARPRSATERSVRPRIRVLHGDEIALGPGKVSLLQAIHASGSLTVAARSLGMSYMRAWKLVRTMNACFREPLVATRRGGKIHGSAVLTRTGELALALYRGMEEASRDAMDSSWQELLRLLK